MTLILNLPPEAEEQLKAAADAAGQDVNAYAVSVVLRGIQGDTQEAREATTAILAALEDAEAGDKGILLSDYVEQSRGRDRLRDAQDKRQQRRKAA